MTEGEKSHELFISTLQTEQRQEMDAPVQPMGVTLITILILTSRGSDAHTDHYHTYTNSQNKFKVIRHAIIEY